MGSETRYAPKLIPGNPFEGEYYPGPAQYIPTDAYVSARDLAQRDDPTRSREAVYPTHLGSENVLYTFLEVTYITKYQLGKILGCKHESYVYKWFNGSRRPGALYLSRICHLLMLLLPPDPLPIEFIRSIDWATSEITWRTGLTTKDDHYWPGFNADKKNRGKPVPSLEGGVEFNRNRKEIPVQKVPARESHTSF